MYFIFLTVACIIADVIISTSSTSLEACTDTSRGIGLVVYCTSTQTATQPPLITADAKSSSAEQSTVFAAFVLDHICLPWLSFESFGWHKIPFGLEIWVLDHLSSINKAARISYPSIFMTTSLLNDSSAASSLAQRPFGLNPFIMSISCIGFIPPLIIFGWLSPKWSKLHPRFFFWKRNKKQYMCIGILIG